ncbi:MAG: TolC family protein [Betaproteobacteria bacterium]|nr:TolC family protein [Betaproteobacteria bacterium]
MNKILISRSIMGGLFISLFSGSVANAEQIQGKTLAQAIEAAESTHLSVRISKAEMDEAGARVAQAKAQFYPTLDVSARTERINNKDKYSGVDASVDIPPLGYTATATVEQNVPRYRAWPEMTARQNVYTGGRLMAQLNQANLSQQAADLSQRIALQQMLLDTSSAFFKLRRACIQHSSATRQLERAKTMASTAKQRLREGRISSIEERTAALALVEKQSASRSREEYLELAYADYRSTIQNAMPEEREPAKQCQFANAVETDFGYALKMSDQTLDEQYEKLKLAAAREGVAMQSAALRPQVNLYANYQAIGRSDDSINKALSDISHRKSTAAAGLLINLNVFDSGLASQRVSEAEAKVRKLALATEQAAMDREHMQRRRELEVRMAKTRIDQLFSHLEVATAEADVARQQLRAGTVNANYAEERIAREQDARDEIHVAHIDHVLARLAVLFSSKIMQESYPRRTMQEP